MIDGVRTDVAGFFGRGGPQGRAIEVEAREQLRPGPLGRAAHAFFENGGRKLYVAATAADLAEIDEIALVAAPTDATMPTRQRVQVMRALLAHAEACRYRFALVDGPPQASAAEITAFRRQLDSSVGALYHPWITTAGSADPVPPSAAVAGLLARSSVHRAAGNQPLIGTTGLAGDSPRQPRELNQLGVNVLRRVRDGGVRTWGAHTMSTHEEWKYVHVRRYALFLERSLDEGTRWAVFEPNAEPLWSRVRRAVGDFLLEQWRGGALRGRRPDDAFFVRCDQTTMTDDDIHSGRLVCVIGVAPVRPAEYTIIRISQWTADREAAGDGHED